MKPAFENLEVECWVHDGKLGLTQPSICLFHSSIDAGAQLLDALREIETDAIPSQRKLTFAVSNRKSALRTFKLRLVSDAEDLKVMSIQHDGTAATIEMTTTGLPLAIDAVKEWLAGVEDFGVSPSHSSLKPGQFGRRDRQSGELWFWGPSLEP